MSAKQIVGSLQLGGQDRPFATGEALEAATRALHHRKEETGQPLGAAGFHKSFGPDAFPLAGNDARDFVYSALVAGYTKQGLRIDFTLLQVGRWLTETPAAAQPLWEAVTPPPKPRPAKRIAQ